MNLNKICPRCDTEYLPHIGKCADCGAILLSPEEYDAAKKEKSRLMAEAIKEMVIVREGDLAWLGELREVLIDAGIPCSLHSDRGCRKGCCGDTCRLVVSPQDRERAHECIEEYLREIDPEFRISDEMLSEGKCPACGSPVAAGDRECKDCGLPLLITGEED